MPNLLPMIPDHEIDTFLTLIDDAVALAAEGKLADGYGLLLAGLHYTEEKGENAAPVGEARHSQLRFGKG